MMFSRILILLLAGAALGACGSVESRDCADCLDCQEEARRNKEVQMLSELGYVDFPQAEAPRYEHDERTQKERDLEAIGRKN